MEEIFSWVGSPQRSSSFWPVGAVKRTVSSSSPGATGLLGRWVCDRALVHLLRFLGDRHVDQLVLVRLDHHQQRLRAGHLGVVHNHVGGLGQAARQRGDRARRRGRSGGRHRCRCRRSPPSRPAAPSRPAGAAAGPRRPSPSRKPKSNRPLPTADSTVTVPPSSITSLRRAEVSESATQMLPSASSARPEDWANQASCGRAVQQAFQAVAGDDGHGAGARVEAEDLVHAGHGDHDGVQLGGPDNVPGRAEGNLAAGPPPAGRRSAAPSSSTRAGPVSSSRCTPLPARVLTVPSAGTARAGGGSRSRQSRRRSRSSAATSSGQQDQALGFVEAGRSAALPSAWPLSPEP